MGYLFLHCRALGQGAFGEVYEGTYKKSGNGGGEMTVAVKTLAELRTNQVCPLSNNLCHKGGRRAMGFRRSQSLELRREVRFHQTPQTRISILVFDDVLVP